MKMSASGNTFTIFDNRNNKIKINELGKIDTDGVILLENSRIADFKMRIFNKDGSEAKMCGNGIRCLAKFINILTKKKVITIETLAGVKKTYVNNNFVSVNIGIPHDFKFNIPIKYKNKIFVGYYVNTGVPHTILFVKNIENVPVKNFGRFIRNYYFFKPDGTNSDFVEIISKRKIKIRTYERGVEDETYSCGTGSCAGAIVSYLVKDTLFPLEVITKSNEKLIVDKKKNNELILSGKVNIL
jgi:diaminopimelate epimerase